MSFLTLLRFTLPTVVSMWVFVLYTMIDGLFVGRVVGAKGLAALTLVMPLVEGFFAFGVLFGVGGSVLAAIHYGEGKGEKGDADLSRAFWFSLAAGVLLACGVLLFAPALARWLGADEALLPLSMGYLRALAPFVPCFLTGYGLEVACKVDRSPSFPLLAVTLGGVTNLVGDWITVCLLDWSVMGAALATGLAQTVTFSLLLWRVLRRPKRVCLGRPRGSVRQWLAVPRAGISEFCLELSMGLVIWCFNRSLMFWVGSDGVAAFGLVGYVANLAIMTSIGTGQGALPLISELWGRGEGKQVVRTSKYALALALAFGAFFYALSTGFAYQLAHLFLPHGTPEVAIRGLQRHSLAFLLWAPNLVIASTLTALGKPREATAVTLARGVIVAPAFIFLLPWIRPDFIWWAQPVTEVAVYALALPLYLQAMKRAGRV